MRFTDAPRPGSYVSRVLTCGHEERVDPAVLEQRPGHLFWCRTCADLHAVAGEES